MARENRYEIVTKSLSSNHQLSVGAFPEQFMKKSEQKPMIYGKDNDIMATEVVPKTKKSIKGKIIEEEVIGKQTNVYKGK